MDGTGRGQNTHTSERTSCQPLSRTSGASLPPTPDPLFLSLPGGLQTPVFEPFQGKQSRAAEVLKAWHEAFTDRRRDSTDVRIAKGDIGEFSLIHLGWAYR